MSLNDDLARRVREERKKRHMSQQQLADAAGISKGTLGSFETRKREMQPENLRSILAELDMLDEDPGEDVADETRAQWDSDVQVFLDILGLYLMAQPVDKRPTIMRDVSAWLFSRRTNTP